MSNRGVGLSGLERQALLELGAEMFEIRALVDAVSFRADHEELRPFMRRLHQLRYIDEDSSVQEYRLTVLGLRELNSSESIRVLEMGSKMLSLFRKHYKRKETRRSKLLLNDIAHQLGVDRQELDFAMLLLADVLSLTSSARSTNLRDEDAYVIPSESVFDYPDMARVLNLYEGYRNQAISSTSDLPRAPPDAAPVETLENTIFGEELLEAVPGKFHALLREIDFAYVNGLMSLSVSGLRTVIDEFAVEQVGDVGGFQRKIEVMAEKKLLNTNQVEILSAALEVGHAAAHRMHVPSKQECGQVVDVVVHMLREVYVLRVGAQKLRGSAPPRGK